MANKKIFMSVTASAVIASAFWGAESADAATYKVKSGDSLWKIAQKFDTSVSNLKSVNGLSGDIIFPNQLLETEKSYQSSNSNSSSNTTESTTISTTYTVKSGDTLSGIAAKHNTSWRKIMKWNDLSTTIIHPGDRLIVSEGGNSSSSSNNSSSSSNSSSNGSSSTTSGSSASVGSTAVYTVQAGDTLSGIGSTYGVSVRELKNWNSLSSDLIFVGQKLTVKGGASSGSDNSNGSQASDNSSNNSSSSSAVDTDYDVSKLISVAKSQQGTPYSWGGSTPGGFDCSGFITYVYNKAGKNISRMSSASYYNRSHYVNNPKPGDLVFFENTYKGPRITHMGIYLGGGNFIHAGSDGVEISNVNNSYWSKHFDSYKRFY